MVCSFFEKTFTLFALEFYNCVGGQMFFWKHLYFQLLLFCKIKACFLTSGSQWQTLHSWNKISKKIFPNLILNLNPENLKSLKNADEIDLSLHSNSVSSISTGLISINLSKERPYQGNDSENSIETLCFIFDIKFLIVQQFQEEAVKIVLSGFSNLSFSVTTGLIFSLKVLFDFYCEG